jgi:hypothetical protein
MKTGKNRKKFWIIVIIIIVIITAGILFFGTLTGYGIKGGTICEDSDAQEASGIYPQGYNIFVEGSAKRSSIVRVDECVSETSLKEYYCQNPYLIAQKIVQCENKCVDAACV